VIRLKKQRQKLKDAVFWKTPENGSCLSLQKRWRRS